MKLYCWTKVWLILHEYKCEV